MVLLLRIGVQDALVLSVEYSHPEGVLLLPESVNVPLPPLQIVAELIVPPMDADCTVIIPVTVAEAHVPEAITE